MVDTVTKDKRSQVMAAIRSKDTGPEISVRRGLHALGFRYSLHPKDLPGRPDITFRKFRAVIFVHGCYWHGHDCGEVKPSSSNRSYWASKIAKNKERDARNLAALEEIGWRYLTIWECSFRRKGAAALERIVHKAARWLQCGSSNAMIIKGDSDLTL